MLIEFQKGKRRYEGFLADEAHLSVKNLKEFRGRYDYKVMGLHLNGKSIGQGALCRWRGSSTSQYLQTENTQLYKGQRNKGHGIVLYMLLIEIARMLGVKCVYSSRNLNRHSRRMWSQKLSQIYNVKTIKNYCTRCNRAFKNGKKPVYFIDLQEK